MSLDPDYPQAADAWLDTGKDVGQGRILLDILNDSPAAARDFAALARVHAALEIAPLSEQERHQRAAKLLSYPFAKKLRHAAQKPATRWSAAAAILIGGVIWMANGPVRQTNQAQSTPSHPSTKTTPPLSAPAVTASLESLPPADPAYLKLMDSLLIPDFEAVDLSLQEAVASLTDKTIQIGSLPLTVTMQGLTDDLLEQRVNLRLKYQPAPVLLKLMALQTGLTVDPTGESFRLRLDPTTTYAKADTYKTTVGRWESFLQSQGQGLESADATIHKSPEVSSVEKQDAGSKPPAGNTLPDLTSVRAVLLMTLNGNPESVEITPDPSASQLSRAIEIGCGPRLHAMLELLLAGPEAPGTLSFDLRWAIFKNHAAVERMFNHNRKPEATAGTGGPAQWSEENLPQLLTLLTEDPDVKVEAAPPLRIAPGREGISISANSMALDQSDDTNWKGQSCSITNSPSGDKTVVSLKLNSQLPNANGGISTHEMASKLTLSAGSSVMIGGNISADGEHMLILTARLPGAIPYGIPVSDKPGFVRSPYALDKGMVDVGGIPPGTKVYCPYSRQTFRIPE